MSRDCTSWVDAKINLYSLIYYQLKLKYLYIFEGQMELIESASAEDDETSQDEANIFLLKSKIAFRKSSMDLRILTSKTDSLIQEKTYDQLEEDVYSKSKTDGTRCL